MALHYRRIAFIIGIGGRNVYEGYRAPSTRGKLDIALVITTIGTLAHRTAQAPDPSPEKRRVLPGTCDGRRSSPRRGAVASCVGESAPLVTPQSLTNQSESRVSRTASWIARPPRGGCGRAATAPGATSTPAGASSLSWSKGVLYSYARALGRRQRNYIELLCFAHLTQ